MPLSLYIHIPFCLKRCIYCDFVSGIYSPAKELAYISALKKEILNIPNDSPFTSLYIGGGTPTVLSTNTIANLISHIFKHLSFTEDYEATIEANPGTVDKEKLKAIRSTGINPAPQHRCGVNRVSIGAQSFNDEELDFLGRLHSSSEAEQAVCLAREAGFENIGIDLIYGIPGQSIESWKGTLQKAVSLEPKHISTYELTVEEGTVLHKLKTQNSKLKITKEEEIIEMYEYTIDYLKTKGFVHYEISNFAIPNYFCKHNLNYWQRGEYYGAGVGAHSFVKRERFYNTGDFDDYIKTITENKSPVKESETITKNKAISEAIFLGLRRTEGINLKSFANNYRNDLSMRYQKEIRELRDTGLLELKDNNLRLTRKGILLSNEVFTRFM